MGILILLCFTVLFELMVPMLVVSTSFELASSESRGVSDELMHPFLFVVVKAEPALDLNSTNSSSIE